MIILGAGLAGCVAAHLFPGANILEACTAKDVINSHKALLRFRTDALSKITGVPFRKVRVYKSVFFQDAHYLSEVPIPLMNMYARKVTGAISDRSISNLAPVDRWVAPPNLHEILVDRIASQIDFSWPVTTVSKILLSDGKGRGIDRREDAVISTIPLPVILKAADMEQDHRAFSFMRAPIFVSRYGVDNCDVFQTIYFPFEGMSVYRASITGNLLIVESMGIPAMEELATVRHAFGLSSGSCVLQEGQITSQQYGKIVPLPEDARHAILLRLTREKGVYSLGRFACWRNLLLDDLPADAEKIRALMRMTDYEATLRSLK